MWDIWNNRARESNISLDSDCPPSSPPQGGPAEQDTKEAIIATKEPISSTKESISATVKLASEGADNDRVSACRAIAQLAAASSKEQLAMLVSSGSIPALASCAEALPETRANVVQALGLLASSGSNARVALRKEGGIEALVTVAKCATSKVQLQAIRACGVAATGEPENKAELIRLGFIAPVVALARSGEPEAQRDSAKVIAILSQDCADAQKALGEAGALQLIIRLIKDVPEAQESAARAIANLIAGNSDNQRAVSCMGGIAPLVALLSSQRTEVHDVTARALAMMAFNSDFNQSFIARAGGITALVNIIKTGSVQGRTNAACALSNLASGNTQNKIMTLDAGGIVDLISLLDGSSDEGLQRGCAAALANLAYECPECQNAIINAGGIDPLVRIIKQQPGPRVYEVQRAATFVLSSLAICKGAQDAIANAGGLPAFVRLAYEDGSKLQALAARALGHLGQDHPSNAAAIGKLGGITPLIRLLDRERTKAVRLDAATALENLMRGSSQISAEVASKGGIALLVQFAWGGSMEAQQSVARSLTCIAASGASGCGSIVAGGGAPLLVRLTTSQPSATPVEALTALVTLTTNGDAEVRQAVAKEGGIPPLVQLLTTKNTEVPPELRGSTASALAKLASDGAEQRAEILRAPSGGLNTMGCLVREGVRMVLLPAGSHASEVCQASWILPGCRPDAPEATAKDEGRQQLDSSLVKMESAAEAAKSNRSVRAPHLRLELPSTENAYSPRSADVGYRNSVGDSVPLEWHGSLTPGTLFLSMGDGSSPVAWPKSASSTPIMRGNTPSSRALVSRGSAPSTPASKNGRALSFHVPSPSSTGSSMTCQAADAAHEAHVHLARTTPTKDSSACCVPDGLTAEDHILPLSTDCIGRSQRAVQPS